MGDSGFLSTDGREGRGIGVCVEVAIVDGAHEEVGEEAEDEEAGHYVEDEGVGGGGGDVADFDLVFAEIVDEDGAEDAGDGPTREQAAVDGADVVFAEHVAEVGGDGGEAAAVHAHDYRGDEDGEGEAVEFAGAH